MTQLGRATDEDIEQYLQLFDQPVDAVVAIREHLQAAKSRSLAKKQRISTDTPTVVQTHRLTRHYRIGKKQITALDDVSVTIRQGEFVALTGPSGSGKSTLLQTIGGLDKPSDGQVLVNNIDIAKLSDAKLSYFRGQTIGFVFQFFYLQPFLNVRQNIDVPGMFAASDRLSRKARIQKVARAVGLEERLLHMPSELSGGQMQRVAIARALLNQPKILLADEPTGNLDSKNSKMIIDLFEKIRQEFGTTVIIVTHDREIAYRADREIRLLDGKLA